MAHDQDLIDFEIIETQKENIQSLPSGRSAKSLAQIFSPVSVASPLSQTQNLNDALRAEYEKELLTIDDSDDPLDIYDRYVKWTLNAYPAAQATPASQLLPLLERATKTFLSWDQYKNDPRYLKLWLHYIRFFSDSPREIFAYLSRHEIGTGLALYYEEFAAWLEGAGRWGQADEIYIMGVEKGARPSERLMRKYTQFQQRAEAREQRDDEPQSPALPTIRPALAAKVDPFAASARPVDPQAQSRAQPTAAPRRQKLQIFSDEGVEAQPAVGGGTKGWSTIGSVTERKKENTIEARPWAGEKLNVGSRQNVGAPKMPIFRDQSLPEVQAQDIPLHHLARDQVTVNKASGKREKIFVNLEKIYPNPQDPSEEYCFEELRAAVRGWSGRSWRHEKEMPATSASKPALLEIFNDANATTVLEPLAPPKATDPKQQYDMNTIPLNDENAPPSSVPIRERQVSRRALREDRGNKTRKIKAREVKNETQTIQTNLSSPKGPKLRRKKSAEPTMTMHAKIATDEVYELFNQPLQPAAPAAADTDSESSSDEDEEDDDYTSAGESTVTGQVFEADSDCDEVEETQGIEIGEDVEAEEEGEDTEAETTRSELTGPGVNNDLDDGGIDASEQKERSEDQGQNTDQNLVQDLIHMDAQLVESPDLPSTQSEIQDQTIPEPRSQLQQSDISRRSNRGNPHTSYNRLPFMTPIVEKTESSSGTIPSRIEKDYFNAKTPCPKHSQKTPVLADIKDELWSSPFQEDMDELPNGNNGSALQPVLPPPKLAPSTLKPAEKLAKDPFKNGPIVRDAQCNPMDDHVRRLILESLHAHVMIFDGFHQYADSSFNRKAEIRKYCKSIASMKGSRTNGDKTVSTVIVPPILHFGSSARQYALKRELGTGAYAPVYLVETVSGADGDQNSESGIKSIMGKGQFGVTRSTLEAVKMEDPPNPWEFYIIRTAHRRLGVSRASQSIIQAYEMHLFQDEGYLIEEYRDQGTLLDLVNSWMKQNGGSAVDEQLAMFFVVELLRTVEALHAKSIIHCDLKADNVLLRLTSEEPSVQYCPDGSEGWSPKGITLIDLGRGIDMRAFRSDVQFTADWETSATDCAEMREMRPWTYQADYHGLAAIAHTLLFGRYIETVAERCAGAGVAGGKTYKLRENLKRYWQADIWGEFFGLMLNPVRHAGGEEGQRMPCLLGMKAVRENMEAFLVANSDKSNGLKHLIRKAELLIASKKKA